MTTLISAQEIESAKSAASSYIDETGDHELSFEVLAIMFFIAQRQQPKVRAEDEQQAAPDWFTEGMQQFAGRRITSKLVMESLNKPTDMASLRQAGQWLRQICGEPKRSGGKILFTVPGGDSGDASPGSKMQSLASKAVNFVVRNSPGMFAVKDIAKAIGCKGTQKDLFEIGRALHEQGFKFSNGQFIVRFPTNG